jgi:5'-nucleotidase
MPPEADQVALIDLDGTLADYDQELRARMEPLRDPNEPPFALRYEEMTEKPHLEARRKLIQGQPGFWKNLPRIPLGFDIVDELRTLEFTLHVLTKGPKTTPIAWSEKLVWCRENIPDALVTVTQEKSLVYGKVLVDDFPPYFLKWLSVRPRGFVVCVAQPWNASFLAGGTSFHPRVFRYDGTNRDELKARLHLSYNRKGGEV